MPVRFEKRIRISQAVSRILGNVSVHIFDTLEVKSEVAADDNKDVKQYQERENAVGRIVPINPELNRNPETQLRNNIEQMPQNTSQSKDSRFTPPNMSFLYPE